MSRMKEIKIHGCRFTSHVNKAQEFWNNVFWNKVEIVGFGQTSNTAFNHKHLKPNVEHCGVWV